MPATIKKPDLLRHVRRVKDAAPRVAAVVCHAVLDDAVNQSPTVPQKTGFLRGSGNVRPAPGGAEAYFGARYALWVHEAPPGLNYTEPGSGPRFLSSKLARNAGKYNRIAAEAMAGRL